MRPEMLGKVMRLIELLAIGGGFVRSRLETNVFAQPIDPAMITPRYGAVYALSETAIPDGTFIDGGPTSFFTDTTPRKAGAVHWHFTS